jgi:T-complex protein 1 subunit gamma
MGRCPACGRVEALVLQELALDAVNTVAVTPAGGGEREIDIKKYIKIEKIPGGSVEDCRVLKGVMFNKARL